MDGFSESENKMNPRPLRNFLGGAGGILAGLAGFLVVVLALNYFSILPLSKLLPQQFGFLPQKDGKTGLQSFSGTGKTVFSCPFGDSPCPKAEIITKSTAIKDFKGLGYKDLSKDTDILAIEGGKYNVKETTPGASGEDVNIYITTDQKLTFGYRFKGSTDLKGKGSVVARQPIGILNGNSKGGTSFGGNYNLIFSIKDVKSQKFLDLTPSQDGILTKE